MGMAGLWESWTNQEDGEIIRTFCIVTIGANELMAPIHDRMPVILRKEDWKTWLNPEAELSAIGGLVCSAPAVSMEAWPVSRKVSDRAAEDGPELVTKVEA
jgi:putative SOS response-associated peptidase YedK